MTQNLCKISWTKNVNVSSCKWMSQTTPKIIFEGCILTDSTSQHQGLWDAFEHALSFKTTWSLCYKLPSQTLKLHPHGNCIGIVLRQPHAPRKCSNWQSARPSRDNFVTPQCKYRNIINAITGEGNKVMERGHRSSRVGRSAGPPPDLIKGQFSRTRGMWP